jgi:WD40 repeat protein
VTYSPDEKWIASASGDQTIKVWDAAAGQLLRTLKGHASEVLGLAFSPDGSRLASVSPDGTVKVWALMTSQESRLLRGRGSVVGRLAYSPDGTKLASTAPRDSAVSLWDVKTGQAIHTFPYEVTGPPSNPRADLFPVTFCPDSRIAAGTADGSVWVWDVRTREVKKHFHHSGVVLALASSPDGSLLASAGDDKVVVIWDSNTGGVIHRLPGHTDLVTSLAFNRDGTRLASCGIDKTVKVWDTTAGKLLNTFAGHLTFVQDVAFHPDGTRLASAGDDNVVIVWELATDRQLLRLRHPGTVNGVAFSPDGERLASACEDGTVKIWEATTGLEALTLRGHTKAATSVAFSPNGQQLASGSHDGDVRIWDARPLTLEASIEGEALGLLDCLFAKPLAKADVLDYLRSSPTIRQQARKMALELAEHFKEETDPKKYHAAAWPVLRHPYANVFVCRFALAQMNAACKHAPDNASYRLTLGVAQYRLGQFEKKKRYPEALATLTGCDQQHPVTLAFLAMTQHQLGEKDHARATLARLREIMKTPQSASDAQARAFLREAEELIAGRPAQPRP